MIVWLLHLKKFINTYLTCLTYRWLVLLYKLIIKSSLKSCAIGPIFVIWSPVVHHLVIFRLHVDNKACRKEDIRLALVACSNRVVSSPCLQHVQAGKEIARRNILCLNSTQSHLPRFEGRTYSGDYIFNKLYILFIVY